MDVENQARVHLWYESKFGYPIEPYSTISEAIFTWPTTATAVAVTMKDGMFQTIAPFGIDDLLAGIVRPNKKQITREIYERKLVRWRVLWPKLSIIEW